MLSPIPGTDFKSSKEASLTLSMLPKFYKFIFDLGPMPSISSKLDEKSSLDLLFL